MEGGSIILLTKAMAKLTSVSGSSAMSRFTWCLRCSLYPNSGSDGYTVGGLSLSLHLSGCWLGGFSRSFTMSSTTLSVLRSVLTDGSWVIMSTDGLCGLGSLCGPCTIVFWLLVFWVGSYLHTLPHNWNSVWYGWHTVVEGDVPFDWNRLICPRYAVSFAGTTICILANVLQWPFDPACLQSFSSWKP